MTCQNQECPECPDCTTEAEVRVKIKGEIEALKLISKYQIDSLLSASQYTLDSIKFEALQEVSEFRKAAIYQVDTMRANMFTERDSIVARLSRITMEGNMIIHSNGQTAEAKFDEVTGKPVLIMK